MAAENKESSLSKFIRNFPNYFAIFPFYFNLDADQKVEDQMLKQLKDNMKKSNMNDKKSVLSKFFNKAPKDKIMTLPQDCFYIRLSANHRSASDPDVCVLYINTNLVPGKMRILIRANNKSGMIEIIDPPTGKTTSKPLKDLSTLIRPDLQPLINKVGLIEHDQENVANTLIQNINHINSGLTLNYFNLQSWQIRYVDEEVVWIYLQPNKYQLGQVCQIERIALDQAVKNNTNTLSMEIVTLDVFNQKLNALIKNASSNNNNDNSWEANDHEESPSSSFECS